MKNLLLIVFALVAMNTFAQENATTVADDGGLNLSVEGGPEMTFETETLDYGTIVQGSDRDRYFVLTNSGNEPLIISTCKGSCGCTVPVCPKEPVLPGQTTEIKVAYDTNRLGQFTKTVTISANTADATKVIKIKGNVIPAE